MVAARWMVRLYIGAEVRVELGLFLSMPHCLGEGVAGGLGVETIDIQSDVAAAR